MIRLAKRLWNGCPRWLREMALLVAAGMLLRGGWSRRNMEGVSRDVLFVAGFFRMPTGLGESARLYADQEERKGKKVYRVDLSPFFYPSAEFIAANSLMSVEEARQVKDEGTVAIHCNPPHYLLSLIALGRSFVRSNRLVACWAWELERIPWLWRRSLRYVDEVEVLSRFTARAIERDTRKKVLVRPRQDVQRTPHTRTYAEDGVTRVLFIFDLGSNMVRKNPEGAIKAYTRAFPDDGLASFSIKVGSSDRRKMDFEALRSAAGTRRDITFITRSLSREEINQLYRTHDIYISLHRSEGYGLTMHEALMSGLHVVGTNWSGNLDFFDHDMAHPVEYRLVPVDCGGIYGVRGSMWAEPDLDHATAILLNIDGQERGRSQGKNVA